MFAVAVTVMKSPKYKNIARALLLLALPIAALCLASGPTAYAEGEAPIAQASPPPDENSSDLFSTQTFYTFSGDFRDDNGKLGHSNSLYNDFSYDHRWLINGKWYFRTGLE